MCWNVMAASQCTNVQSSRCLEMFKWCHITRGWGGGAGFAYWLSWILVNFYFPSYLPTCGCKLRNKLANLVKLRNKLEKLWEKWEQIWSKSWLLISFVFKSHSGLNLIICGQWRLLHIEIWMLLMGVILWVIMLFIWTSGTATSLAHIRATTMQNNQNRVFLQNGRTHQTSPFGDAVRESKRILILRSFRGCSEHPIKCTTICVDLSQW